MSWTNKNKVSSTITRGRILTPDGNQILLGSSEDLILIYQEQSDYWQKRAKVSTSWTNKNKVASVWTNKTKIEA
jgi:hypothetical protein